MIAILALVALISAFLIASALNRTSADVSNEREDRSMGALRKAKAALIAHAANEQWQLYKALPKTPLTDSSVYFQPGALPCPDQDDDGDADCTLPNTSSLIGRVPYKTIGLDDPRDASGERLWYALSHDFRKLRCTSIPAPPTPPSPSGCTIINSDTQGQLTVVGIAPATQVVAVLFAPGEALQGQNRDPANASAHNDPLNYLEGPPNLSNPVNYVFTTASPSAAFNDRVLTITRAEIMDAVEPVVAANIERDVKPLFGHLNAIGADASRAVALATAQAERADRMMADLAVRVEQTLNMVQTSIGAPAREGRAMMGAFRAAMQALREMRKGRGRQGRGDDEDPLFI